MLVFEKDAGFAAGMFFGSGLDARAYQRLRLNIIDQGDGTYRVIGTAFMVGNRGTAFEREDELSGKAWQSVAEQLEIIKQSIPRPIEENGTRGMHRTELKN